VTLEDASDAHWATVQGPDAAQAMSRAFGERGFSRLPEGSVVDLGDGSLAIRRSLGGDVGFLVRGAEGWVTAAGLRFVAPGPFSDALEVLRIEAGLPLVGPDTP